MGQFSLANLFGVTLRESANDGSDFTNPDADYRRVFLGEDGELHAMDSAGTVTTLTGGSAITAHLADTSDAHDASAISVLDTAANFTGTDVEAVLAELQDNIDGVSAGGLTVPTLLQSVKGSADTPDAEFDGAITPFSAVDGTAGTATLLAGSGAGIYDVSSRDGWVLMQVGTSSGDSVLLKQDYTIPDGSCIVAALSFAADDPSATANNEIQLGIGVNNNDSGPFSGAAGLTLAALMDTNAGNSAFISYDGTNVLNSEGSTAAVTDLFFVRIDRSGLVYNAFFSRNGFSWSWLGSKTMASAADNVWLIAICGATMSRRAVVACPWFRQGTALAVDPWAL